MSDLHSILGNNFTATPHTPDAKGYRGEHLEHPLLLATARRVPQAFGMYFTGPVTGEWAGDAEYRVILRTDELVVLDVAEYERMRALCDAYTGPSPSPE